MDCDCGLSTGCPKCMPQNYPDKGGAFQNWENEHIKEIKSFGIICNECGKSYFRLELSFHQSGSVITLKCLACGNDYQFILEPDNISGKAWVEGRE